VPCGKWILCQLILDSCLPACISAALTEFVRFAAKMKEQRIFVRLAQLNKTNSIT